MTNAGSTEKFAENADRLISIRHRFAHWWHLEEVDELEARCKLEGYDWITEKDDAHHQLMIRKGLAWPIAYDRQTMTIGPKILDEYGRPKDRT